MKWTRPNVLEFFYLSIQVFPGQGILSQKLHDIGHLKLSAYPERGRKWFWNHDTPLSSIFTQSWKTVHQSGSLKNFCQGGWSKWRFCYASGVKRLFLVIVICKFYKLKFSRGRGREVWIPPPLDPCMYMYAQLQPLCTSCNFFFFVFLLLY